MCQSVRGRSGTTVEASDETVLVQDLSTFEPEFIGGVVEHVLRESAQKQSWADDDLQLWLIRVRDIWHKFGANTQRVAEVVTTVPVSHLRGALSSTP